MIFLNLFSCLDDSCRPQVWAEGVARPAAAVVCSGMMIIFNFFTPTPTLYNRSREKLEKHHKFPPFYCSRNYFEIKTIATLLSAAGHHRRRQRAEAGRFPHPPIPSLFPGVKLFLIEKLFYWIVYTFFSQCCLLLDFFGPLHPPRVQWTSQARQQHRPGTCGKTGTRKRGAKNVGENSHNFFMLRTGRGKKTSEKFRLPTLQHAAALFTLSNGRARLCRWVLIPLSQRVFFIRTSGWTSEKINNRFMVDRT